MILVLHSADDQFLQHISRETQSSVTLRGRGSIVGERCDHPLSSLLKYCNFKLVACLILHVLTADRFVDNWACGS